MRNITFLVLIFVLAFTTHIVDVCSAPSVYKVCARDPVFHLNHFFHHWMFYYIIMSPFTNDSFLLGLNVFLCIRVIDHNKSNSHCTMSTFSNQRCGLPPSFTFRTMYTMLCKSFLSESNFWFIWWVILYTSMVISLSKMYSLLC